MARWTRLDGLNPEQRRAAEAVRGPVCILAGAGSGKTTTITRRIAQQVASGAFAPTQIMAVTFTDKAAGEMSARLAALGAARRASVDVPLGCARASSATSRRSASARSCRRRRCSLRQIANPLPAPYKFRPAGDLATEIERAKTAAIPPDATSPRSTSTSRRSRRT